MLALDGRAVYKPNMVVHIYSLSTPQVEIRDSDVKNHMYSAIKEGHCQPGLCEIPSVNEGLHDGGGGSEGGGRERGRGRRKRLNEERGGGRSKRENGLSE